MKNLPENFDWEFYLEYYEDLRNAGLKTKEDAETHYLNHGQDENRIYVKNYLEKIKIKKHKTEVLEWGVNIIGFGDTISGLGHNMRMMIEAFKLNGIPYNTVIIDPKSNAKKTVNNVKYDINIVLINPDFNYLVFLDLLNNKYNIALWAWELDLLPNSWLEHSKIFSEIWTISDFCLNVFKKELTQNSIIKKINIPGNFKEKKDKNSCKEILNLSNKFILLFIFDYVSCEDRKNPKDLIETFNKTLSKKDDCVLIIKTHNAPKNYLSEYSDNILIINEVWDEEKVNTLFNSADVYVSLHRSEGSGLTIMEAINLEIPIITTNYSGNLDFCDENCLLVDYELTKVATEHPTYNLIDKNFMWANINLEDAQIKMNEIYDNYGYYKKSIKITKEKMVKNFNLDTLAQTILGNLKIKNT
jgi:glycosyltransferase involved in cell wall biosynthesis